MIIAKSGDADSMSLSRAECMGVLGLQRTNMVMGMVTARINNA